MHFLELSYGSALLRRFQDQFPGNFHCKGTAKNNPPHEHTCEEVALERYFSVTTALQLCYLAFLSPHFSPPLFKTYLSDISELLRTKSVF